MDKFTSGNIGEVLEEVNKGRGGGSHGEIEQLEQDVEKLFNEKSDIYSTNEKIVGEWIDGASIYQKTLIVDNPTMDGNFHEINIGDYNTIIDIFGTSHINDGSNSFNKLPYYYNSMFYTFIQIGRNKLHYAGKDENIDKLLLTIKYTKAV